MRTLWPAGLAVLLLLFSYAVPGSTTPPHGANLDNRIAAIVPKPDEDKWLQIPWRTNLMQARQESLATGKPLFLWVMVGNPQGCT